MGVLPGSEGGSSMPRPPLPGPAAFAPRGFSIIQLISYKVQLFFQDLGI